MCASFEGYRADRGRVVLLLLPRQPEHPLGLADLLHRGVAAGLVVLRHDASLLVG
jgi:hypothetical protein